MTRAFRERKLVIASHNQGKLQEIKNLLEPFDIEIFSISDFNAEIPEETEDNFRGNAKIKALAAARETGLPALADDSGLMIDALDGAPGVYSADWAETENGRDFHLAMSKVLALLKNAPRPWSARFVSTICLAWPDEHCEFFEGFFEGQIVPAPKGEHGFGYDPIFQPDGYRITCGEMEFEEKNRISHRVKAFEAMVNAAFNQNE